MRDEYEESEKRREVMDERILDLRRKHGLLRGLFYVCCYVFTLSLQGPIFTGRQHSLLCREPCISYDRVVRLSFHLSNIKHTSNNSGVTRHAHVQLRSHAEDYSLCA